MFSKQDLQSLLENRSAGPRVSIYMPTVQAGSQTLQNPIRFKNLLRQAEDLLRERGIKAREIKRLLERAGSMTDDQAFWQHQDVALAVFIAQDAYYAYRLPIQVEELALVQDRFYIRPLLQALSENEQFYVLTLSQNRVRLFECNRYNAHEVELEGLPRSLADALGNDLTKQHLKYHTASKKGSAPWNTPNIHDAANKDDVKADVRKFFGRLNEGINDFIQNNAPLVLAGVDYLLPIYREETNYSPIVGGIEGNFDQAKAQDLHTEAWKIVEPFFAKSRLDALAQYESLTGTGRAVNALEEIVTAAVEGRVDTLLVARTQQKWGKLNAAERWVSVHDEPVAGDEELLDLAAAYTYQRGGRVFIVESEQVPDRSCAAAVLRY
ncbi:MAG: hypothetical protein M3120_03965 [Pseudomonadota bacterium]|nr:hypothetical protein [Pseudomonadota bacterium]